VSVSRPLIAALVMLVALIGCGQQSPTPEPTAPPVPAIPNLWRTVAADDGDVTLVVPPDLIVTNTSGGVSGFREPAGNASALIVSAVPPARVNQPTAGESIADWVRLESLTSGRGELGAIEEREVLLPAGPSLEMTGEWMLDGQERWMILYVIDTGRGFAVLAFDGDESPPDAPTEEVRLMRELVTFGP
jgi:hypothetical protein